MTSMSYRVKKLADGEAVLPGFSSLWRQMKASASTKQRAPKYLVVTDRVEPPCPDDRDCARRYAVDLATMKVVSSVHLSCGEWATANSRGEDRAVDGVPEGAAVVTLTYNDYYGSSTMTVQVRPGSLVKELPATGG
jgi:hypothetical protein